MNNATIPYVTRNLRHLLAAPNLTELQRTIITRTLATLSELGTAYPEWADEHELRRQASVSFGITDEEISKMSFPILTNGWGR
ncbi:hypothetical protein AB1K91_17630 [Terribacillus sp. 179-K 1B1 HS]|uniref:hypothetical protein n=1 Tax=Terribacillus sp. 179-K 1B1 HS TaxID=3142388 RepID=UPI0039A1A2D5